MIILKYNSLRTVFGQNTFLHRNCIIVPSLLEILGALSSLACPSWGTLKGETMKGFTCTQTLYKEQKVLTIQRTLEE